eukprot:Clim_evm144s149 gene=Clim_evmTU144s149
MEESVNKVLRGLGIKNPVKDEYLEVEDITPENILDLLTDTSQRFLSLGISDDRPKVLDCKFEHDAIFINSCARCGFPETVHTLCERFYEDERDAERCKDCGRHELDHKPCFYYMCSEMEEKNGMPSIRVSKWNSEPPMQRLNRADRDVTAGHGVGVRSSSLTADSASARGSITSSAGVDETQDLECSHQIGSHTEPCVRCGRTEEDHNISCLMFRPGKYKELCKNCGRGQFYHDPCEHFKAKEDHREICANCGLNVTAHTLCLKFHGRSSDALVCESCGRYREEHLACRNFESVGSGTRQEECRNCGKKAQEHVWTKYVEDHFAHDSARFGSFAREHDTGHARWFVDGEETFASMADAFDAATTSILICGWFMSPELYMRRGPDASSADRLDHILTRAAERGVKVYMLLWNETKIAFLWRNGYARRHLEKLNSNIKILLHPGPTGPINWSHHGKCIIIDQLVAFVGGLDLSFGRWDTSNHVCEDACHLRTTWPGKDFYNPAIDEMRDIEKPYLDCIDRMRFPRMPWHDVAVAISGDAVWDLSINFMQRWNHHRDGIDIDADETYTYIIPDGEFSRASRNRRISTLSDSDKSPAKPRRPRDTGQWKRSSVSSQTDLSDHKTNRESGGRSLLHPRPGSISPTSAESLTDRTHSPPTMNTSATSEQELTKIPDASPALGTTRTGIEGAMDFLHGGATSLLEPGTAGKDGRGNLDAVARGNRLLDGLGTTEMRKHEHSPTTVEGSRQSYDTKCQVVRSIGFWSGANRVEDSYYEAFVALIEGAKHCIYVENQYLLSRADPNISSSDRPDNLVAAALVKRISRAIENDQDFKVVVVVPIYPEGTFEKDVAVRYIMHLQQISIYKDPTCSILGCLRGRFPDVDVLKYITFLSLRSISQIGEFLVTEQIYVHSKLMIIDDRTVLLGSANINDRSLLGERDSEVGLVLTDNELVDGVMNERPVKVGKFAHTLRCRLWMEHFNARYEDVVDPICDYTYNVVVMEDSIRRGQAFEAIFPCIPRNDIEDMEEYDEQRATLRDRGEDVYRTRRHAKHEPHLNYATSGAVPYPLYFLRKGMRIGLVDWGEKVVVADEVFM